MMHEAAREISLLRCRRLIRSYNLARLNANASLSLQRLAVAVAAADDDDDEERRRHSLIRILIRALESSLATLSQSCSSCSRAQVYFRCFVRDWFECVCARAQS